MSRSARTPRSPLVLSLAFPGTEKPRPDTRGQPQRSRDWPFGYQRWFDLRYRHPSPPGRMNIGRKRRMDSPRLQQRLSVLQSIILVIRLQRFCCVLCTFVEVVKSLLGNRACLTRRRLHAMSTPFCDSVQLSRNCRFLRTLLVYM